MLNGEKKKTRPYQNNTATCMYKYKDTLSEVAYFNNLVAYFNNLVTWKCDASLGRHILVSLKLVQDKVEHHKPSLLPLSTLGTPCEQIAADLCTLVSCLHLFENGRETHSTLAPSLKTGRLLS